MKNYLQYRPFHVRLHEAGQTVSDCQNIRVQCVLLPLGMNFSGLLKVGGSSGFFSGNFAIILLRLINRASGHSTGTPVPA